MDFHPDILGARFGLGRIHLCDILWTGSIGTKFLNGIKDVKAMIGEGEC